MFDFFAEIIEYCGQTVDLINWGLSFIRNFFGFADYAFSSITTMVQGFPLVSVAMISLVFVGDAFDFVRGR